MANTVNQPDGTSVSPKNPPAPAAGGGDNLWVEAYSVNWAAQSVHDFSSTATLAVGGVTWTALNNSADIQTNGLRTDGSNGLCIWPDGSERIWDSRVDAPIISVLLKDAVGAAKTYAMNKQAVCFQCTATASQDISNNYDAFGAIFMNSEVGTSNGNARYLNVTGLYDGGTRANLTSKMHTGNLQYKTSTGIAQSARDFFQIIIWPGPNYIASIFGSVGDMPADGNFPDPNNFTPPLPASAPFSTLNDSSAFTLANARFGMSCAAERGSAPDANPIFSKCRVLYMDVL